MKKVLLFVAIAATLSFAACKNQKSDKSESSVDSDAQTIEQVVPVEEDTAAEVVDTIDEVEDVE
jgi:protein involved in sex pheromone biosynthesis